MLVVLPAANVFADENDGVMTIGQTIPVYMDHNETYSYANGIDTYVLRFEINGTYERGTTNVSNVNVKPSANWQAGGTDSALSAISVLSVSYTVSYRSNYAIVTVNAKVSEQNNGDYRTKTRSYSFRINRYN